jgi:hypothetical protein
MRVALVQEYGLRDRGRELELRLECAPLASRGEKSRK